MARTLLVAFVCLSAAACSPKLIIRHEDPTVSFVQVRVDQENAGFLDHGGVWRSRVARGYHRVETIPRGASENPWAEDGEGWTIYVDRRAEVTLLPQE